jgi:hypothetical protein
MKAHGQKTAACLIAGFVLPSFLITSIAFAQTAGTFTPTGHMTTPRFLHAATLLADGRVLIAGGQMIVGKGPNLGLGLSLQALASAEIYDPSTGVFTPTGAMTTPRVSPSATLLPDGRALIMGGGPGAELYDPNTGTFRAITSAAAGSSWATLLNNGKVLIINGRSAQLYDPVTDTSTATGGRTTDFVDTATLLPNGKVLITTGNPEGPPPYLSSAELYDPSIGSFAPAGYTTVNHSGPTATLLPNGTVLLAGGDIGDGDGASRVAEVYDSDTGTFSITDTMIIGREQSTATLLADGTVLFAGGHLAPQNITSAELYDPITGTFAATGNMVTGRELYTATLLKDGRVLIAGGDDERYWVPETILSSAELYTTVPDPWRPAATALKAFAGTNSLNFWQWAWFWQRSPTFSGAPAGFGVIGSIDDSSGMIDKIIAASGGGGFQNVSAEQWVSYLRCAVNAPCAPDPWLPATTAMKAFAGTNSLNFWQWAWFWQRSPAFSAAPTGFGVMGSIDNTIGMIGKIIAVGGGGGFQNVSAEQWVLYFRAASR